MGILDPKFRYEPAATSDIRKAIRRELKRLAMRVPYAQAFDEAMAEQSARNLAEARDVVRPIKKKSAR